MHGWITRHNNGSRRVFWNCIAYPQMCDMSSELWTPEAGPVPIEKEHHHQFGGAKWLPAVPFLFLFGIRWPCSVIYSMLFHSIEFSPTFTYFVPQIHDFIKAHVFPNSNKSYLTNTKHRDIALSHTNSRNTQRNIYPTKKIQSIHFGSKLYFTWLTIGTQLWKLKFE